MPRTRKSSKVVLNSTSPSSTELQHGAEPNSNQATNEQAIESSSCARSSKSPNPRGLISKFSKKRRHELIELEESDDSVETDNSEDEDEEEEVDEGNEDAPLPVGNKSVEVPNKSVQSDNVVKKKLSDKKVPTFDGTSDVDDYIDDARFYVRDNADELPFHLLEWLLTGLSGVARTAVRSHRKNLKTPEQLFKLLIKECRPTGTEQAQLENIIQNSDESITTFSSRIKQQLERMECSKKMYKESYIAQLTKGSLPEISAMMEKQIPASVKDAYRMAKFIEERVKIERLNSKRSKPKPSQSSDAKINVLMNQDKLVNDKFEALNDKIGSLVNVIQGLAEKQTPMVDRNQQEQYCNNINRNNNNNNYNGTNGINNNNSGYNNNYNNNSNNRYSRNNMNKSKSSRLSCFICGKQGHGYMNCFNANSEQKLQVRDRLQSGEHLKAPVLNYQPTTQNANHLNSNVASSNPQMMQH